MEFVFDGEPYSRPSGADILFAKSSVRLVSPASFDAASYSTDTSVSFGRREVSVSGFDCAAIGSHKVRDKSIFIRPAGDDIDIEFSGVHARPSGDSISFGGTPPSPTIYPAGIDFSVFGEDTRVKNSLDFISGVGAIPPANGYGTPSVWLYTRYLKPGGADTQAHGTQWASHYLRYVTAAGTGDNTARGTPWVSRSPRELAPAGFDAMGVLESHVVGGTRHIFPSGTEMTEWGTRIIPEGQVAYPAGFAGEAGKPDVQLRTRYMRPQTFQTNPDDLRFGRQDVWNLRQVVQQDYDPNDGLNPPPFGQWTGIENRNKEPVPVGWLSERIGYQFVWNKASPVVPAGIKEPPTGAGSVTHWRRTIAPDGIDSLASERWHATYNKAAPLRAQGDLHQEFGHPALENRSRLYDKVGNFDSMAVGAPMVADSIRTLSFESRYSVEPPPLPLPEVKLHTRYIEYVSAGDKLGAGSPVLDIRWTYIAPKWAFHPPAFIGEPALRNVTPELRTGGMNHEEFGQASIRTQWRRVETKDGDMTQWGRPIVRDRRHWVEFVTAGAPPNLMPGPKVTKVGGLPDPKNIIVSSSVWGNFGFCGEPALMTQGAFAVGFDSQAIGGAVVTANSIRVEPGYGERLFSPPAVSLKNREISVGSIGDLSKVSKPSVSPHTIYSVVEAPGQAVGNHPHQLLHYVDHDTGGNSLKGCGRPTLTNLHRPIAPHGVSPPGWFSGGLAHIFNARQYAAPQGTNFVRFGIPVVPNTQAMDHRAAADGMAVGTPTVARGAYFGPQTVLLDGIAPPAVSPPVIDFRNGHLRPGGFAAMVMGASIRDDTPFMWRGLRVGPLIPNIAEGFDASVVQGPWVSLRVRDMRMDGFDSAYSGYDIDNFHLRARVRQEAAPRPPTQRVVPEAITATDTPAPDLRAGRHYIRPDGNAEQYRKGAPQ